MSEKKPVLFISPNFPPPFYNFCIELKNAGAIVLAIGDTQYSEFRKELKDSLTEYCQVDMSDYESIYKTVAYLISKYGRIFRIDSHNEYWLNLESRIRQDFNIFGQKPEALIINQSKLGMKRIFQNSGVPCVEAISIANPDILYSFVQKYGFPLIIKPDIGVGAANTYKISNEYELAETLRYLPPGYIMEPYVDGKIVTFDGLTDRNGEILYCASFEVSDNMLDILKYNKEVSYYYPRNIDPVLEKYGRHVVKGFNVRERFFHCEFFRCIDGSYKVLEINVRLPGGFTVDMLNYVSDINIFKVWAELVMQNNDNLQYQRKYNVANVSRRDRFEYKYNVDEISKQLGSTLVFHTRMPDIFSAAMGNDVFILRHRDLGALFEAMNIVKEKKYT